MKTLHTNSSRFGHTLVEMMIAMVLTTIAVAAATSGLIFWVRGERYNATQCELDMNVRKTMESLKHDLRLSALDKIFFYPPGPGPYTAISFPIAADTNNDGLVEMTPGGSNILWQSTVIYHVWSGSPNELRRTEFVPRDNSLTDAQAQAQLASVVTNGDGTLVCGTATTASRTIFANLFTWNIWGKSATFDGYSATVERDTSVSFGSILLGSGAHTVKFSLIGKNTASSGYKVGIDTLTASPCGAEREGEYQLPVAAQSGATAVSEYMTQGSWNGNYQLSFPATTTGNYFSLNFENDRWEERHFRGQGALCQRTIVGFDTSVSMNPKDYILQLEGSPGYPWGTPADPFAWTAENQTDSSSPTSDSTQTGSVIRVLLRGGALAQNAGAMRFSGQFPYVLFVAPGTGSLKIKAAYIAEASDPTNYTMNAKSAGVQLFRYGTVGTADGTIDLNTNNSAYMAPGVNFATDANKSYLITYLVDDVKGNCLSWPETHSGAPGCYIIPGSAAPTSADAQAADWSSKAVSTSSSLIGVYALWTTYPTNGLFTSQIFDTKIAAPVYSTISWSSVKPTYTSVKIKVRTGNQDNMGDAPAWSNVTAFLTSPANITCGNKRYIQFQAILDPDSSGWNTPKLQDVTIKWAGDTKVVDVAAIMTKGPNYGICEVTVDDKPLVKGLQVDLTIYKTIVGWSSGDKQLTSSMSTEIEPRNTGK
jgi:hypothetical protein